MASHAPRRCLVAVSSHGFGHLSQVTPIINAATQLVAEKQLAPIQWIIRSTIAPSQIQSRLTSAVDFDAGSDDFGMIMHDAIHTDLITSLRRYVAFHTHWEQRVDNLAQHLQSLHIDAILADVPYLTLAAAARAQIPSQAICSLNWADILLRCVSDQPTALAEAGISTQQFDELLTQMIDAYQHAQSFLRPEPSMDMPLIRATEAIGPVCEAPADPQRESLDTWAKQRRCGVPGWLVLVSMGGIPTQLNMQHWPTHCLGKPIYYIVAGTQTADAVHSLCAQSCPLDYATLFASCDLIISKPGYGTFVEAASLSKPLIYIERPSWPEAEALTSWFDQRGHSHSIDATQLNTNALVTAMTDLLSRTTPPALIADGQTTAAKRLLQLLDTP